MNDSFDRLLKLAQSTGDTLIVFDKQSGSHQVVMDIDKYEGLVHSSNPPVGSLTEQQLIDRLNKDISLWRDSQQDQDISPEVSFDDSYVEDATEDWHSAADVLDNMHPEFEEQPQDMAPVSLEPEGDIEFNFEPQKPVEQASEAIEYDPLMQEPAPIPMIEQDQEAESEDTSFQEEPLDDEPIFFEEPIQ